MTLDDIGYTTEPTQEWGRALDDANTLDQIRAVAVAWEPVARSAIKKVACWSVVDFDAFRMALSSERRGRFMGEEAAAKFGDVLMPSPMFEVSMVAQQFKVPWGLAYIRLRDAGRIVERDGVAEYRG